MKRLFIAALFAVSFATPAFAGPPGAEKQTQAGDPVVHYADDDAEMNAARAEARRTYPMFLAQFRAASPGARQRDYMVKLGLDGVFGRLEHIWVDNLHIEGDRIVGALANEPVELANMFRGSPVVVEEARVSDWAIISPQGMYGNFTTRVMMRDIAPDEAARLREVLAPTALPPGWSQ
ncbi:MAG: YegJ family protein [Hyphomonadaceae bacterium]